MSSPVRTAVLGYGFAGRIFHSPFIAAVPGLELSAIVTSSTVPARSAAAAAADYPKARILSSPAEAFADPAIDLVVVATPNSSHFELAEAALRAGKHVVVDKPLATRAEDAQRLAELAEQTGRVLAPFHNRRWDTDFLTLQSLISAGALGRITQVYSNFDRYRPLPRPGTWKERGLGNGLLFDLGPHLVDQAVALFGAPTAITASVRHDRDQTDIEDGIDLVLEYQLPDAAGRRRELRYQCSATMLAASPAPRLRVFGTQGAYVKTPLDPQEAALLGGARPGRLEGPESWIVEPESAWGTLSVATRMAEPVQIERRPLASVPGDYRRFYANVCAAITQAEALTVTPAQAVLTVRLLELAQKASDQRRTLAVA